MATHLGTANGTGFNKASMKPESNDQTDALWSQNLADNLMWLATREQQVINHSVTGLTYIPASSINGTLSFKRLPGHDAVYGTIHLYVPPDTGGDNVGTVLIDGTMIAGVGESASIQTVTFNWDLSAKDAAPAIAIGELINVVYTLRSGEDETERSDIKGFQAWSHNSLQFQL